MINYLNLSKDLATKVKIGLVGALRQKGFFGVENENPEDVKSTHKADKLAIGIIEQELKDLPCQVYMESYVSKMHPDPQFTIFIDPLDGSLNWDRGVGDAAFALAIIEKPLEEVTFGDLTFSYVEGLRSGDFYYAENGKSFFHSALMQKTSQLQTHRVKNMSSAHAYLKSGYQAAQLHFTQALPLYLAVKDIRAFDQSAIEICEIARNAADIMLENRNLSDFYNLLAYPVLKFAGGSIFTLDGVDLASQKLNTEKQYDFIAGNDKELLMEALEIIR
jgi:fructose-1,6-bisphosphatase/inositol monophosphatase family enzyme